MNNELKFLTEQRAEKLDEMKKLVDLAKAEKRGFTDEELKKFEENKTQSERINATIRASEAVREEEIKMEEKRTTDTHIAGAQRVEDKENIEIRAFGNYLQGKNDPEIRTALKFDENGVIVPTTIDKKIIQKVEDLSPVFRMAQRLNVKGDVILPYYGMDGGRVVANYVEEFVDIESTSGKFTSVELKGHLLGAHTQISKKLLNNNDLGADFLLNFMVNDLGEAFGRKVEYECINGVGGTGKMEGILTGAENIITAATAGKITPDDLIELQESIPDVYQSNGVFIMNSKTRTAIRKYKDTQGNYLLNPDLTAKWGYTLLGKPIYTTDSMLPIAEGNKSVIYADLSGFTINLRNNLKIQVLHELFALKHVVGVVGHMDIDSKVTNQQKIAVLQV